MWKGFLGRIVSGNFFDGLLVHFGSKVIYWNKGIFLGYRFQPGFIWKKDYFVTPLKGGREAIQDANFKILRTKGMEHPDGEIVFSLQNDEIQDPPPPNLDVQTRFSKAEDKLPEDLDDDEHQDLFELFGIGEGETSPPRGEATEGKGGDKKASDQGAIVKEPSGSESTPETKPMPVHDPTKLPGGKPGPPGFNWDGVRLVRNKRGSKRPPDTPFEFWRMYSAKQREEDIARYTRRVELEEERLSKKREEAAPAMPVMRGNIPEPHREGCSSCLEKS